MTFTPEQIHELKKKLESRYVQAPPRGKYGSYLFAWHVIEEANRIFGHDGWSYQVKTITETNCDQRQDGKWAVGYLAVVSVSVGDIVREDAGHGQGHGGSLGDAHDSALKEAVTDALKRALRTFGNPFGLALYDKSGANIGDDEPPKKEREPSKPPKLNPSQDEGRARQEFEWLANRELAPHLSGADSKRVLQVLQDGLDLVQTHESFVEYIANNKKPISNLSDTDYLAFKWSAQAKYSRVKDKRDAA